jgi:transketolase
MELVKHLNQEVFSNTVEKIPNRNGYGEGLKEAGESDSSVVALSADLTESTRSNLFAEAFPERFVQVGIAEQNMASVASGMAAMGKIPFIASYAMFSPGRSWEQVRTTIAYNNANVKIIGAHSGVSVGPDGATHQAIEDIALMRVVPNMTVLAPCDVHEAKKMTKWAAQHFGPVYMRIAREKTPVITTPDSPLEIGKLMTVLEVSVDNQVTIISTGTLLHEALLAGKALNESGIATTVIHMGTIKPLDVDGIIDVAKNSELIVTVEEHQIAGGMGSAVAECLSENYPNRVIRIGVNDQFGQSGEPEELIAHYGMNSDSIINRVKHAL